LAKGMPDISSTGLKGERSWSRAGCTAENYGLDEEMLRATERSVVASEEPPGPRSRAMQARTSSGVTVLLLPFQAGVVRCASEARKAKRQRLGCLERRTRPR
jgi:hypothetical protein